MRLKTLKDQWYNVHRLGGLRRFAVAITAFNVLGHLFFGFEQSVAQPLVALAVAYGMALLLEGIEAWTKGRAPRFAGGLKALVDFLLPAHITGLALAMLLYANDQLWPIAFGAAVAVGAKAIFRAPVGQGTRHFFNPSNLGIAVVLIFFPWVSIAPPYHFTENLVGAADWILPGLIVCSGTYLNARFTKRMPLIAAWLGGFFLQAILRSWFFGTPVAAAWMPMTGVAFVLFTFYMVTDPATSPGKPGAQVLFGAAVAAAYAVLMVIHVVFGLFFSLAVVCALRGMGLHLQAALARRRALRQVPAPIHVQVPTVVRPTPALPALSTNGRQAAYEREI